MDGLNLPRYRSHKVVRGAKIGRIELDADQAQAENRDTDGSALLYFEDPVLQPIKVDRTYVNKHQPSPGGYFVVYEDGYKSWSPTAAFEEGYTLVDYPCAD